MRVFFAKNTRIASPSLSKEDYLNLLYLWYSQTSKSTVQSAYV